MRCILPLPETATSHKVQWGHSGLRTIVYVRDSIRFSHGKLPANWTQGDVIAEYFEEFDYIMFLTFKACTTAVVWSDTPYLADL